MKDVAHSTWFGGVYQDPKNFFSQFVIEPEQWRAMYPEFVVPDEPVARTSWPIARASSSARKLAQRFGWKIGDHVPLKAPGYLGGDGWDFNVRAIYHGTRPQDDESQLWLQHQLLLREGARATGRASSAGTSCAWPSPDEALRVAKAIDAEFANSTSETRTQTESAFAASFMKQMGNIEFLILAIGSVVFFTLLLVTGQHDGDRGARAHGRAGRAEGGRLLGPLRARPRARRVDADRGGRRRDRPRGWPAASRHQDITSGILPAVPVRRPRSPPASRSRSAPASSPASCPPSARCA